MMATSPKERASFSSRWRSLWNGSRTLKKVSAPVCIFLSNQRRCRDSVLIVSTLSLHPESESEEEEADWGPVAVTAAVTLVFTSTRTDAVERFLNESLFKSFPLCSLPPHILLNCNVRALILLLFLKRHLKFFFFLRNHKENLSYR